MLAAVLDILAEFVVIINLGLRSISKRITSLIFLNIYTPPRHAWIHIILFVLKYLLRPTQNLTLKIKENFHINWKKPNINAQQNHLALTLSL